jgi:hypothetical protein
MKSTNGSRSLIPLQFITEPTSSMNLALVTGYYALLTGYNGSKARNVVFGYMEFLDQGKLFWHRTLLKTLRDDVIM